MSARQQHLWWFLSQPETWIAVAVYAAVIAAWVFLGLRTGRRRGLASTLYGAGFVILSLIILVRLVLVIPMFEFYVSGGSS